MGLLVKSTWPFHTGKKYHYYEIGGLLIDFYYEKHIEIDSIGASG